MYRTSLAWIPRCRAKAAGLAATGAIALGLLINLVGGGFAFATDARAETGASDEQGFVGAWQVSVTGIPGAPSFPVVISLLADGVAIASGSPAQPAAAGAPNRPVLNATGHGAWEPTGPDACALTFVVLNADEQEAFLGTLTVRGTQQLAPGGAAFTGSYVLTVSDPTGAEIASFPTTAQGTRIGVEPVPAGTPSTQAISSSHG